MKKLDIGDKIPPFTLNNQFGESINIDSFIGRKNIVIYFYPKDDTPGCTAEACSFRDSFEEFTNFDCEVIGISSDDEESHRNFATKHRLKFTLLSDSHNIVRKKFGVPTNLFGLLPGRVTYIIDKTGTIQYIFNSQFQASKHISKSLKILEQINNDGI